MQEDQMEVDRKNALLKQKAELTLEKTKLKNELKCLMTKIKDKEDIKEETTLGEMENLRKEKKTVNESISKLLREIRALNQEINPDKQKKNQQLTRLINFFHFHVGKNYYL